MADEEQVRRRLEAKTLDPEAEEAELRRLAAAQNVTVTQEKPEQGFAPFVIAFIILGAIGAVGVVEREIEVWRGGQIVDERPGAPSLNYRDHNLEYGRLEIRRADGTVTLTVDGPKDLIGLVLDAVSKIATDLGKETIDQAAQAVKDAAAAATKPGATANVTTGPALAVEHN